MYDDLLASLQTYGLAEKEAKIYLSILSLGTAPASTLARRLGIKRSSIYSLLDDLKKRGFLSEVLKDGVKYYVAVDPQILLAQLQEKYEKFKSKMPDFLSLIRENGRKPKLSFLEGESGIKAMFADYSVSEEDMRVILGTKSQYKHYFTPYAEAYRAVRKQKGLISRKILSGKDIDRKKEALEDKKYGRETLIIEDLNFGTDSNLSIYGPGKVCIYFFDSEGVPQIVLIESQAVYLIFRGIFEYLRETQKRKG